MNIIEDILNGEDFIYPGHPIIIALFIMDNYECLDDAMAPTDGPFLHALRNDNIPGAGGEVYSALYLLLKIQKELLTLEEAVEYARENWKAGGHIDMIIPTQEQADRFQDCFIENMSMWITNYKIDEVGECKNVM